MSDDLENKTALRQEKICIKYGADFLSSPFNSIIGVALDSFNDSKFPIHGLRHSVESENNNGWYIWAGDYSSAGDFFKPLHVTHLFEICPKAVDYLGLSPGWRFLFDDNYEDIWYDENLLLSEKKT